MITIRSTDGQLVEYDNKKPAFIDIKLRLFFVLHSSVQNVLLRYGIEHELNFILPQKKFENQFVDENGKRERHMLEPFQVMEPHHFTFNIYL